MKRMLSSYFLITTSVVTLAASILLTSNILALVGLGLLFWGIIFSYLRSDDYLSYQVVNAASFSQNGANELLHQEGFSNQAIYLSPKYCAKLDTVQVWVPKSTDAKTSNVSNDKPTVLLDEAKGIYLTAPGNGIMRLFENILDTDFGGLDLPNFLTILPKLLVDELEIVKSFRIDLAGDFVSAEFGSRGLKFDTAIQEQTQTCFANGIPLCSAIACALTKVSGRNVCIRDRKICSDGKTATIYYQLLD